MDERSAGDDIAALEVVEPLPQLRVRLKDPDVRTIVVDGLPGAVAMEIDWKKIVDTIGDILGEIKKKGDGCKIIKITNSDGSSPEISVFPHRSDVEAESGREQTQYRRDVDTVPHSL